MLQANDFTYVFDKRTGLFEDMQFAGRSYIDHPMELNIWRAPTDNDMYIKKAAAIAAVILAVTALPTNMTKADTQTSGSTVSQTTSEYTEIDRL